MSSHPLEIESPMLTSSDSDVLLEHEGYAILNRLAIATPRHVLVPNSEAVGQVELHNFPGTRVVVKAVSPRILHKTDVGAVRIVAKERAYVRGAVEEMERRLGEFDLVGFLICEFIDYDPAPGAELLLSARWTDDFGPVVFLGMGGVSAEYLSAHLRAGTEIAVISPVCSSDEEITAALRGKMLTPLVTGTARGSRVKLPLPELTALLQKMLRFAESVMPHEIREIEINPLALTTRGPVALDVLCKRGAPRRHPLYPPRPLQKLRNLLRPQSIAILGVSERMNVGRIILKNVLRSGFSPDHLYVIKRGLSEIDGCRCYPGIAALPEKADLLILAMDAAQTPEAVQETIDQGKAESFILISGGLSERAGEGAALEGKVRSQLAASRFSCEDNGPIMNGGNCLGIRSVPGKFDTLFIPPRKLKFPRKEPDPIAVISQSGAFLVAASSKLSALNPCYLVSVGNQTDLTVGDYLMYLKDDPAIETFACYVEGFREMDGLHWLKAAREITASGRNVILYRAGRTAAGAAATASHTASIAGQYVVTRELARQAGVIVAETLQDFTDLMRLFSLLRSKEVRGTRIAAISNAGFECVALADNLGNFRLASLTQETTDGLYRLLQESRLAGIVAARNPLDLTPILDDAGYEASIRTMLQDENVDVGIVGCVPLTGALNSLPPDPTHTENLLREDSVAMRMIRLQREFAKAWIAVIDAGAAYDPMVQLMEQNGVPVFRSADRALRLFDIYCSARRS